MSSPRVFYPPYLATVAPTCTYSPGPAIEKIVPKSIYADEHKQLLYCVQNTTSVSHKSMSHAFSILKQSHDFRYVSNLISSTVNGDDIGV